MQEAVAHVKVDSSLHDYALEIVNRTRKSEQLALGVSPRGTLMLQRARKPAPTRWPRLLPPRRLQTARRFRILTSRCRQFAPRLASEKIGNHDSVLRDIVESVPVSLVIGSL